jgi:tetratricopeptide (TPR) repeat protein
VIGEAGRFGQEAAVWRREAARAMGKGDLDRAERKLRDAHLRVNSQGRSEVAQELAIVLAKKSGQAVEKLAKRLPDLGREEEDELERAVRRLEEAAFLFPESKEIQTNLSYLESLLRSVRERSNIARRMGGTKAFEIRQTAVEEFNAGRHARAVDFIQRALLESKGPGRPDGAPEMKKECAEILAACAAHRVNEVMGAMAPLTPAREASLEEARRWLQDAFLLAPDNAASSRTSWF